MSGDHEPLIPGREEPLIPFTDRRAPILTRLRERRGKRNNVGVAVGNKVAELTLFTGEEERLEEARKISEGFRTSLSNKLGVPEEAINSELIEEFTALFAALDESDIVNESILDTEEESEDSSDEDESNEDDSNEGESEEEDSVFS